MSIEIACCVELGDAQVYNHLLPLAQHPLVSKLWIIRSHNVGTGIIPKSEFLLTEGKSRITRWCRMIRHCNRLAKRKEVAAFVSFNPIPYGLISYFAAHRNNKPVHFGFIGSDWYNHCRGITGSFLTPTLRKGSFFTVTGELMRNEMINRSFPAEAIKILPHSIDLDKYTVNDPDSAEYDCIFVGQLIRRKRVDLILKAFADVLTAYPRAKLCIVGDGPLRQELELQASELGITGSVTFTGYTNNVHSFIRKAKISIIASSMEGFPFALVESMCCGLVPISTPVGTIPDLVENGKTGLIFPQGDSSRLASCIVSVLNDKQLFKTLRSNVINTRNDFSYKNATGIWDPWLSSL